MKKEKRLARIAIRICDETLGPIPRDRTTLRALKVVRDLVTQGPVRQRLDAIKELMTEVWHHQASIAEGDVVFYTGVESDDNAYLEVFDTMHVAFAELERRILFGQKVYDEILDDLLFALLQNLAPV